MRIRSLVLCSCIVACVPPPPVYRVQRAARVPRATVPLRTGEPLTGFAQVDVTATSIAELRDTRPGSSEAAIEVPAQQLRGELRFRVATRGEIAAFGELALEGSLHPLDPTQAPVERGTPWGAGLALRYSFALARGLSLGTSFEGMQWSIPFVEYRKCIQNCDGAPTTQLRRDTAAVGGAGLTFTPTYRIGPVALFAAVSARTHPTIGRKDTEVDPEYEGDDVRIGPLDWLLQTGAAATFRELTLLAAIQHVLTHDPADYGPSLEVGLSVALPD